MHPAVIARRVLGNTVGRGQLATRRSPGGGRGRLAVHLGHVGAKYATLEVAAARRQQYVVRMPVEAQRGRSDLLFEMLRHPERLTRLEVAHAYAAMPAADGEFLLYLRRMKKSQLT